jgi:hypothetical protein
MDLVLVLLAATAFPVACLVFVLWMGRLEDTIPTAVRRSARTPDPAPILEIAVRPRTTPHSTVRNPALDGAEAHTQRIPEQRVQPPVIEPAPAPVVPAPAPVVPPVAGT